MNTDRPPDALDQAFLPTRAKILEIAATLDRIGRARLDADPRMESLRAAIQLLLEPNTQRAEAVQLLFSRKYDSDWRTKLEVDSADS